MIVFVDASPDSALMADSLFVLFAVLISSFFFIHRIVNQAKVFKTAIQSVLILGFLLVTQYLGDDKFYKLSAEHNQLEFHFVNSYFSYHFNKTEIEKVTFGTRNKGRFCYIKLYAFNGDTYQRVVIDKDVKACKETRIALNNYLGS
ncbi:hypothetical protein [Psychrobium sp. 1_MG-2023]|uniref:hypothetical protein n=1 Tax=Psychrobium sp. 1_MG-2023 TaxID=3062624 RepID=UPI0012912E08|nr:hypothetical protein [Psychrobium sp. 1_MG-2023]MDP2560038.1 hypothetical protein [Psychrobium sp. 1_MG-2023]